MRLSRTPLRPRVSGRQRRHLDAIGSPPGSGTRRHPGPPEEHLRRAPQRTETRRSVSVRRSFRGRFFSPRNDRYRTEGERRLRRGDRPRTALPGLLQPTPAAAGGTSPARAGLRPRGASRGRHGQGGAGGPRTGRSRSQTARGRPRAGAGARTRRGGRPYLTGGAGDPRRADAAVGGRGREAAGRGRKAGAVVAARPAEARVRPGGRGRDRPGEAGAALGEGEQQQQQQQRRGGSGHGGRGGCRSAAGTGGQKRSGRMEGWMEAAAARLLPTPRSPGNVRAGTGRGGAGRRARQGAAARPQRRPDPEPGCNGARRGARTRGSGKRARARPSRRCCCCGGTGGEKAGKEGGSAALGSAHALVNHTLVQNFAFAFWLLLRSHVSSGATRAR